MRFGIKQGTGHGALFLAIYSFNGGAPIGAFKTRWKSSQFKLVELGPQAFIFLD
jgi:hypothetical protein